MSESDDVAASLVDELAQGGEHVDTGDFTLDPAKAREKLREYQLADAHEWILLAISAGYLATGGRGPVHVHTGARASVQFPAIDVGSVQLEQCFAAVFEREKGLEGDALTRARVLRLLGLAANAALSLRAEIEIENHEANLRIEVRGRGEGQRSIRRERELVLERCSLATTAIFLDDTQISQGPTFTMPLQRAEIRLGDTVVGMAAFEQYGVAPAKALVINRGVLVETVMLPDGGSGFVAIVDINRPTDLAQRQIVRDETWDQLLDAIRAVHDTLPRPRVAAGGPANKDVARPKHSAATAVAMLLGSAVLGLLAVLWLLSDDDEPPSQPWTFAEVVETLDPEPDWFRVAEATCNDRSKCAALREQLRRSCASGTTGEFCYQAGWMDLFGYGGPPSSANELFERGCMYRFNLAGCAWMSRRPITESDCADGDAWACYALGHQAYHQIGDVELSVARFQAACELGLAVGCRAAKLAQERNGPLIAFPKLDR